MRKQPDDMFAWLQRAVTQRDQSLTSGVLFGGPLSDPLTLAYQHDPRFAALCKQIGLPLPGQVLPTPAHTGSGVP
ncbi:MAG: hypothetical protein ABI114_11515 [Rhodanobacter sp.]